MISHHPSAKLQSDYAAGSLTEPFALAVASHVVVCDQCSGNLDKLKNPGEPMSGHVQAVSMRDSPSDVVTPASPNAENPSPIKAATFDDQTLEVIPEPVRQYLSHNLADIPWNEVSGGMEEHRLEVSTPGYRISLVRLAPGCKIPTHTHTKEELTLVLAGGFTDGESHLERGDFSHLDSSITHNPVADPKAGCLALGVLSGPIELTGWMGTLLNPMLRF